MKRWDVLFLLGISVLAYAAWAQDKGDANTITKVEIRGSTVEIIGTRKPSFTSFTMTEPARLVIDISEAVFSGVPEQIPGGGTVSWIKTASYGSDASAIARVLIGFSKEVETDLASAGNKLVIKILDGAPAAVARADKSSAAPKAAKEAEPTPQLQLASPPSGDAAAEEALARKKREERAKEEAAKAEQERIAQAKAEKEAAKRAELAREEARKEEAEKKRLAEEERKRKAEEERLAEQQRRAEAEEAKRQAAAEQKRKADEERLAREQAKAEAENAKRAAAAEQKRKAEEERLAQAKEAAEAAEAKRQAATKAVDEKRQAAAKSADEKRQAAAEAAEVRREEAAQAAEAKRQAAAQAAEAKQQAAAQAAEAKRQALAERKRKAEEERLARQKAREEAAEAKRQALAAKREAKLAASPGKRATMTFVGFERAAASSRVYVRTTGPVRYSVQEDGDKKVVLELENTRIALRNNRRPLDTSFFDSAVAMVSPNPDGHRAVRVEIKLRETVPFQAKQEGNEVSVEFSRSAK